MSRPAQGSPRCGTLPPSSVFIKNLSDASDRPAILPCPSGYAITRTTIRSNSRHAKARLTFRPPPRGGSGLPRPPDSPRGLPSGRIPPAIRGRRATTSRSNQTSATSKSGGAIASSSTSCGTGRLWTSSGRVEGTPRGPKCSLACSRSCSPPLRKRLQMVAFAGDPAPAS
jgi:hypothetical protein